jgi:hypothetical protein
VHVFPHLIYHCGQPLRWRWSLGYHPLPPRGHSSRICGINMAYTYLGKGAQVADINFGTTHGWPLSNQCLNCDAYVGCSGDFLILDWTPAWKARPM